MFDNEIDWVMRIRQESLVPAAARQLAGFNCMDDAIQGRAHCKAAAMRRKQVFNVRRVSLGDAVTVHVNAQDRSQGG